MAEISLPSGSEGPVGRLIGVQMDWATTLAQHDRWLRTAVFTRLGEPQAVDEIMQEVALAAVAQHAPLRNPDRVGAWLYRLALRLVAHYRRRCGRQRRLLTRYAEKSGVDRKGSPALDPLDWLIRNEWRRFVQEALAGLPRRDAEILLLKYTEDWRYRELAEHLGVSESAVEARLHRARKRLREAMKERGTNEVPE
jgi:RNA polymerase sigma factor (sigma-70 family)